MLSAIVRVSVLFFLLLLLHHLLLFQHQVEVSTRTHNSTLPHPARAALVTLADPNYARCVTSLLRQVRTVGKWKHPIILLAVDYAYFHSADVKELDSLGVVILHTHAIFDSWLWRGVENVDIFRTLQKEKFRKMELFLNPVLRSYERLIFVDADGIVAASLEPLLHVKFPDNVSILMRQNDASVGKSSFWENELAIQMLTDKQIEVLSKRFPNRLMTGGSCWFLVDVRKLPSPARLLERSLKLLCSFRAGFRFNDQTLLTLLFYDSMALFPWCVWDEVPVLNEPSKLKKFCKDSMHLQRRLNGDLRFMYRHMSVTEKSQCVLKDEGGTGKALQIGGAEVVSTEALKEHHLDDGADCDTALEQWRRRLPTA